jgi:hypothetical protein
MIGNLPSLIESVKGIGFNKKCRFEFYILLVSELLILLMWFGVARF